MESDTEQDINPAKGGICGRKCPTRYCIVIMLSIGMGIIYGFKVSLHVAIVAMVNHTAVRGAHISAANETSSDLLGDDGPFEWDHTVVGWLLSSYFYGYILSEVPGGRLAEIFSGRWVFFAAVLINIISHLFIPLFSQIHWSALLALRIMQGLGGGMTFPAAHVLIAHWVPPLERSYLGNITYGGTCLGTVFFMLVSGWIASGIGWEAVFYIEGSAATVWLVMWAWLSADTPDEMRKISPEERAFIANSLKDESHTGHKVPWKEVFTSKPFWAILIAHTCSNWGWYMVLVELPQFMVHALHFNMKENATLSALPFFTMWLFSMVLSKVLQHLRVNGKLSMTWLRKIATLFASVVPSICLSVLCFDSGNRTVAAAMMTVAITGIGGMFSGFLANHIDIAPKFAGTLIAITNTVATIPGIVVPIVVGQLTDIDPSINSWRIVFLVTILLYILEIVVYTIMGSAELQDWNNM